MDPMGNVIFMYGTNKTVPFQGSIIYSVTHGHMTLNTDPNLKPPGRFHDDAADKRRWSSAPGGPEKHQDSDPLPNTTTWLHKRIIYKISFKSQDHDISWQCGQAMSNWVVFNGPNMSEWSTVGTALTLVAKVRWSARASLAQSSGF